MGVFFEVLADQNRSSLQETLEKAIAAEPPATEYELRRDAAVLAEEVRRGTATVAFKGKQFFIALVLVVLFCILALVAEYAKLTTGTEGFWDVVKLLVPAMIGFLGGEASGSASAKK